ncbi:MAG: hypothetical protein KKE20_02485 [Nanoarchaeota archaeon]|nr:hypothetical protein [Nanoarchaeota archaeon]
MKELKIFKIEYSWYEGEHDETLIGKDVNQQSFEKDLLEARRFAESLIGKEAEYSDYPGKGYSVECLPAYYEQIIWYLTTKLGYICCSFDECIEYDISDYNLNRISIDRIETRAKREGLDDERSLHNPAN